MKVLLSGVALLAASFFLQLLFWRITVPVRQIKVIVLLFCGVLLLFLALGPLARAAARPVPALLPEDAGQYLQIVVLYLSCTMAYVITYSAVEADSPSLVLVLAIFRAGPAGLGEQDLRALLSDDELVKPRVRDLLTDKMATLEGETYRLTDKGRFMTRLFLRQRQLLGLGKGG